MLIRDKHLDPAARLVEKHFIIDGRSLGAAVALAAIAKTIFPAVYEVVRVTGWAAAASAGARYDVQVGGVSVLNGGPAAPGIGAADPAIPALLAARQGSVAQPLAVLASTEAAGLITDLCVVVTIRYRVHRGDVGMLT